MTEFQANILRLVGAIAIIAGWIYLARWFK